MTDIVERLRVDGASKIEWEAGDEIERLRAVLHKICEPITVTGTADEVSACQDLHELISAQARAALEPKPVTTLDRLIDALAECIVARQGLPNRDRAKLVLAVIEAQGWRLVPPKENDA